MQRLGVGGAGLGQCGLRVQNIQLRAAAGGQARFGQAQGFLGYSVHKGIETPERYLLQIRWATLENHTVDFRGGPLFPQWRAIVGPFFAGPPTVEHFTLLA